MNVYEFLNVHTKMTSGDISLVGSDWKSSCVVSDEKVTVYDNLRKYFLKCYKETNPNDRLYHV